ncbi:MAG: transcription-repair coupling factor (superfamily II helicase) [Nitriliruptoraceae bacterium]
MPVSASSSMAAALDPGTAVGPLAPLLRAARGPLEVDLDVARIGAVSASRPIALALLAERASPLLIVVPRTSDAEAVADGLAAYLGEERVAVFPSWETLPHERLSPQPRTVGRRLAVLDRLSRPEAYEHPLLAVVTPVRAALQPMDPALGTRAPLDVDGSWDGFDTLVEQLAELGYSRTPQVEARGEFAVRGGIVDVFPTAAENAVRIEFWGDDVETLRTFAVGDQRSTGPVERVRIDPARELVLNEALRDRARARAAVQPRIADHLLQLADGLVFEGAESLVTYLHPKPALLPDFMGARSGLVIVDPTLVQQRADKLHDEAAVLAQVAWLQPDSGDGAGDPGRGLVADGDAGLAFAELEDLRAHAGDRVWELSPFEGSRIPGAPWESLRGDVTRLGEMVRRLLRDGRRVVLTSGAAGPARRLADVLAEQGVPCVVIDGQLPVEPTGHRAEIVVSPLREGFDAPELGLAVLGEFDVFGTRRRKASRRMGTRTAAADAVLDLSAGDAVVHRTHGVGRFVGMVTREIRTPSGDVAKRDYVELEYANGDKLFVPSDQVDAVAKYQGGESPTVMRLGGAQWEKAKTRVRKNVRDIAAELIRLYAARMHAPGHAFDEDGAMQRELEDAFAHVETADQLTSTAEIKGDMEHAMPMDRLLVGDVGFGKTEVAVRAAAKAVFGGKQVAVLVPTTILAQQHFETFRERFAGFPVELRPLSRFVSGPDKKATLDGLAAGTVDIVIGTHAILSKSVEWKDLGLVIVDEEQRFGVQQKERLKQLRTAVDVLSMSATPIPRTLEMAVTGIRDLSTIETAPEDRQPVLTFVQEYDEDQIALAIRRELLRDGQVFYLHNQVDTIDSVCAHIRELVPDARVGFAHGQMDEKPLEQAMIGFWEREIDVLVCTTIIESGLDIPNANTLLVERSDLLGLSQLHQLRGRVGRSSERGYAYFLYPPETELTETAYERLETLAEHSRLGSGLAIALRDLEIRGAGNVVGAEQSGQVATVGFDMYAQLLKEEVADLNGTPIQEEIEIRLDLPVDAHLPHDYVEDAKQRLELYKRIAAVRDAGGVKAVRAELEDRFGRLPPPAERLVTLAALKAALRRWGVRDVGVTRKDMLRVKPVNLTESQLVRLERQHRRAVYDRPSETVHIPLPNAAQGELVAWVAATLRDLFSNKPAPTPRR